MNLKASDSEVSVRKSGSRAALRLASFQHPECERLKREEGCPLTGKTIGAAGGGNPLLLEGQGWLLQRRRPRRGADAESAVRTGGELLAAATSR